MYVRNAHVAWPVADNPDYALAAIVICDAVSNFCVVKELVQRSRYYYFLVEKCFIYV